jgi:hypothetical protein
MAILPRLATHDNIRSFLDIVVLAHHGHFGRAFMMLRMSGILQRPVFPYKFTCCRVTVVCGLRSRITTVPCTLLHLSCWRRFLSDHEHGCATDGGAGEAADEGGSPGGGTPWFVPLTL